jgi:putative membrane protein
MVFARRPSNARVVALHVAARSCYRIRRSHNVQYPLATSKGVNLPTDLDHSTKREMDKLSKLSGADFDREYMKTMVSDHKKDVSDFKSEASKAKDPDVKQFAGSTLPTLQEHLQLAQSTQQTANSEPRNTKTSSRASTNKTGT